MRWTKLMFMAAVNDSPLTALYDYERVGVAVNQSIAPLYAVIMMGLSSWASTAFTNSCHWYTALWQLVLPLMGLSRHDPLMPQSSSPLPPSHCGTTDTNNMLWEHLSTKVRCMTGLNSNVCIYQIRAHETLRLCALFMLYGKCSFPEWLQDTISVAKKGFS